MGNCWLISAFAAAAEFPKSVKALCQQQKLSKDGRYDVRLFHPIKDAWEVVTIDDSFPVRRAKLKYAAMSNDGEIWPCVLEKAIAKLFGSYAALEGNTSLMAFKTMFGAKGYELLSLDREEDGSWTCYTPIFNSMDDCIGSRLHGPTALATVTTVERSMSGCLSSSRTWTRRDASCAAQRANRWSAEAATSGRRDTVAR